jgi:hypothetical protein
MELDIFLSDSTAVQDDKGTWVVNTGKTKIYGCVGETEDEAKEYAFRYHHDMWVSD